MKKVITILLTLIIVTSAFSGCGAVKKAVSEALTTNETSTVISTEAPKAMYEYKIANLSYANIGSVTRIVDRVTISEADMNKATEADITGFLKALTVKQLAAHSPDALMIFLYCEGDDTESSFTIARSIYAPAGKWENTLNDANSGYVGYDFDITINSVSERDM